VAKPETYVPKNAKFAVMVHDAPLSAEQFDMMLSKAICTFEHDTAHLDRDELKAKSRPKEEHWLQFRQIVQHWTTSMMEVARQELTAEDFVLLEEAVLRSRNMDQEILAMLARRPAIFHLGMLPSLSVTDIRVDDAAKAVQRAHSEACGGRLKVMEAELQADWATIMDVHQGHLQLRELLRWQALEHRRQQAALAQSLVDRYLGKTFPICQIPSWKDMGGQLALMSKAWDSGSNPKGPRRAVVLLDFNTPHSRDSLRLPSLIAAVASTCKVLGPTETVVLAWMPNGPKEGSTRSADQDEVEISDHFSKEGFVTQTRIRMMFNMPASIANKTSEMDWWGDGRLLSLVEPKDNFWLRSSELARIRRVQQEPTLPCTKDLVSLRCLDANQEINIGDAIPDLAAKYAQRGPGVAEVQLAALMQKVPLSPKDETILIDPLPYVGDRALGTFQFLRSTAAENKGTFKHVVMKMHGAGATANYAKAAVFSEARLRARITKEWLSRTLVLHEMQVSGSGQEMEVPVFPVEAVPPPTEAQLQTVPGALAAYRGLAGLKLQACGLQGPKVKILPDRLAEFQGAPLEVQDALDRLKATHEAEYEGALAHLAGEEPKADEEPKAGDGRSPQEEEAMAGDLVTHESEERLASSCKITEAKSSDRNLHLLRDEHNTFFLVARTEDYTVAVGTQLGGVGGGAVLPAETGLQRCFPWLFPAGDKTLGQLSRAAVDGDDSNKGPKVTTATLYAIARELEASATGPPKLTSFGKLVPTGAAGRHQYTFEFPAGHDQHEAMAWVPKPEANPKAQAANFFGPALHRDTGVGQGPLQVVWRMNYDSVGNMLKPAKPYVVAGKRIVLKKGCPVRVAWQA
jgi:hypothetical protein